MPVDIESVQQNRLDSSGCDSSFVLESTSLWDVFSWKIRCLRWMGSQRPSKTRSLSSWALVFVMYFTHIVFTTGPESGKVYDM